MISSILPISKETLSAIYEGFKLRGPSLNRFGHPFENIETDSNILVSLKPQNHLFSEELELTRLGRLIAERNDGSYIANNLFVYTKIDQRPSENVLLTWASGVSYEQSETFEIFLKSAAEHCRCNKYLMTHSLSYTAKRKVIDHGFHLLEIPPSEADWVVRDRFLHYSKFLMEIAGHPYALVVDSRDVLFQDDPFERMISIPMETRNSFDGISHFLPRFYVASEGHVHEDSEWNFQDQHKLMNLFKPYDFGSWEIINGGFQYGSRLNLAELFETIYELSNPYGRIAPPTDQAVLNYLVHTGLSKPTILDPLEHSVILHGEPLKTGALQFDLLTANYERYAIFHQWDRTKYADEIRAKYSGK